MKRTGFDMHEALFRRVALALLLALPALPATADEAGTAPHSLVGGLREFGVTANNTVHFPEVVFFKTALGPPPSAFKRRITEKKGLSAEPAKPITILGRLYRPDGEGPFPAVVLLHGSGGISAWNERWAQRLRDWGYVVLDVDSMTPRGIYRHNTLGFNNPGTQPGRFLTPFMRAGDAQGAASYLSTLPFVDPERIAALGGSQGGSTVMSALAIPGNPNSPDSIRAGIALYPGCYEYNGFNRPLLVLAGSADEFVSAARCEMRLAALTTGLAPTLKVYVGAHHGFEFEAPDRTHWGLRLQYDALAAADAFARIKAFLAEHLN